MTMRERSSLRVSVWRLPLFSAALAAALVAVSGCGGDEEPDADTSPPATATQTVGTPPDETGTTPAEATAPPDGAPPTQEAEAPATETAPPCPVSTDVCQLAVEFLPTIEHADGDAIADRATLQQLSCPASAPAPDDIFGNALATPCEGEEPGAMVEVYEFHNGKAPFYYTDPAEYTPRVVEALESTFSDPEMPPGVVAVGCGTADSTSVPDCEQAAVVVYGNGDPVTPLFAALIFTQASETAEWRVEKLWSPFPGVIPAPMPESLEIGIYTVGGVQAVELTPYSLD